MTTTNKTIQIGRTEYRIEQEGEETKFWSGLQLVGPRGARWGLIKNAINPGMLFPVNPMASSAGVLKGLWFTVKEGELVRAN